MEGVMHVAMLITIVQLIHHCLALQRVCLLRQSCMIRRRRRQEALRQAWLTMCCG